MNSDLRWAPILVVAACWIVVIGNQLGWEALDTNRYPVMILTLTLAWAGVVISAIGAIAAAIAVCLLRR